MRKFRTHSGVFGDRAVVPVHTGNPVRTNLTEGDKAKAQQLFNLDPGWPTLYLFGGGSGAMALNQLVWEALPQLLKVVQVIHATGRNRGEGILNPIDIESYKLYHPYEFVDKPELAYAAADIVLGRAGIGTISELSVLQKISLIIPMPHTHQETNAKLLYNAQAALILDQEEITSADLVRIIRKLLFSRELQQSLKDNIGLLMPHDAAEKIAQLVMSQ